MAGIGSCLKKNSGIVLSDIVPVGQEHAASITDRLAETADDVPAQLMQEYQDLWNDIFDYPDCQSPAVLTYEELEDELACGYSPENATAFVLECISRITGARAQ